MKEVLNRVMKKNGLTQVDLAKQLQVSQSFISNILLGRKKENTMIKVISILNDKFGIPLKTLFSAEISSHKAPKKAGSYERKTKSKKVSKKAPRVKKDKMKLTNGNAARARLKQQLKDEVKKSKAPKTTKKLRRK